jgi:hypothetical protein
MRRLSIVAGIAAGAGLFLSACTEKPQTVGGAIQSDREAYTGVGKSQYANPGWKAGDKENWAQELKTRAINGQNDYVRISN